MKHLRSLFCIQKNKGRKHSPKLRDFLQGGGIVAHGKGEDRERSRDQ